MAWKFNGPIDHANPKLHDYKVQYGPFIKSQLASRSATLSAEVNF